MKEGKMYREALRLKATDNHFEDLKRAVKELATEAAKTAGCRFFIPYVEVSNPGWIFIDSEFDSIGCFHKMFENETILQMDTYMKTFVAEGVSCVIEEY